MDCSLPGSSVYGISQAKILNWVAIPFSRGSSQPRDHISYISCIGRFYTTMDTCVCVCMRAHSCLALHNPIDYSKQGSSVHGIFQARILLWVVISSSSGSCWPRDWTCNSCVSCLAREFFTAEPLGKPVRNPSISLGDHDSSNILCLVPNSQIFLRFLALPKPQKSCHHIFNLSVKMPMGFLNFHDGPYISVRPMYLWLMEFSQYSWHSPAVSDHDSYSVKNPGYLFCSVQASDITYSDCLDFKEESLSPALLSIL